MKKTWYIKIRDKQKGPYTIDQLKRNREVTPDTLVWIPDLKIWIPMRNVAELKEVFKDPDPQTDDDSDQSVKDGKKYAPELVLEYQSPPPSTFIWVWIALVALALIFLRMFYDS